MGHQNTSKGSLHMWHMIMRVACTALNQQVHQAPQMDEIMVRPTTRLTSR